MSKLNTITGTATCPECGNTWTGTWLRAVSDRVCVSCGHEFKVRRLMAHGLSYRVDRIRSLGNAVVPIMAAAALIALARSLTEDR